MTKHLLVILLMNFFTVCFAQQSFTDTAEFKIINNEKVITNDMIFNGPLSFPKNKKPLYMINGTEVYSIAYYYDHTDFKKITVLQPNEGLAKFGKKGKNGVIMVELKDEVKEPEIEIISNKIYYNCKINDKIIDTTKAYFDEVNGKGCTVLDLNDTSKEDVVYMNFDNEIKIKHLGVGWDLAVVFIAGGTISGTGNDRVIRVQKAGNVRMVINANGKEKIIILKAIPLPAATLQ